MANLQYIGARYVPKFFLNPDDQSNDWKSGVLYEALTIVTYNNDSYTSKVVVPDNVGNPADNPEYWACTTKYTAALVALQTTVGQLVDDVDDLKTFDGKFIVASNFAGSDDFTKLQNAINYCQDEKIYNLIIDKKFDISGHSLEIYLPEGTPERRVLRLIGVSNGEIHKGDSGYMFTSPDVLSHGLILMNLRISGNYSDSLNNRPDVFDCAHIRRITSFNNYITFIRDYFRLDNISVGYNTMQSCRSIGDTFVFSRSFIRQEQGDITDTRIDNAILEDNTDTIYCFTDSSGAVLGLTICNSVIEGDHNIAINLTDIDLASFIIDSCYFEANENGHLSMYAPFMRGLAIRNSTFFNNGMTGNSFIFKGSSTGWNTLTFDHCLVNDPATGAYVFYIDGAFANYYSIALNDCVVSTTNRCNVNNFVYETHAAIRSLCIDKSITQIAGESITINLPKAKVAIIYDSILQIAVELPFIANNTSYSITLNSVIVAGAGEVVNDCVVDTKNNGGFTVKCSTVTGTSGTPKIVDTMSYTITFA